MISICCSELRKLCHFFFNFNFFDNIWFCMFCSSMNAQIQCIELLQKSVSVWNETNCVRFHWQFVYVLLSSIRTAYWFRWIRIKKKIATLTKSYSRSILCLKLESYLAREPFYLKSDWLNLWFISQQFADIKKCSLEWSINLLFVVQVDYEWFFLLELPILFHVIASHSIVSRPWIFNWIWIIHHLKENTIVFSHKFIARFTFHLYLTVWFTNNRKFFLLWACTVFFLYNKMFFLWFLFAKNKMKRNLTLF